MSSSPFAFDDFCDDFGPAKIMHLYDPETGMRGVVVIDNVAAGPSIGGVRMAPDVDTREVFRLARAMTMKNASAGLAHGGGKSAIIADPKTSDREALVRAFARGIADLSDYIAGPDMGTDEDCMAWIQAEIGRSVGLPRVFGGIPLDELGATGFGLARCAEVATDFIDLELKGARLAIEGFGNVGKNAARFLEELGAVLVAASDSKSAIHNPDGIKVEDLVTSKQESGTVGTHPEARKIPHAELFTIPCDILIPAARPDCIHADNAREIQASLILEGANIPATPEAEKVLQDRGILAMPDFICNAGGVICAAVEYHDGTESGAFETIRDQICRNTLEVLTRMRVEKIAPREAAIELAEDRVGEAMRLRGHI